MDSSIPWTPYNTGRTCTFYPAAMLVLGVNKLTLWLMSDLILNLIVFEQSSMAPCHRLFVDNILSKLTKGVLAACADAVDHYFAKARLTMRFEQAMKHITKARQSNERTMNIHVNAHVWKKLFERCGAPVVVKLCELRN